MDEVNPPARTPLVCDHFIIGGTPFFTAAVKPF